MTLPEPNSALPIQGMKLTPYGWPAMAAPYMGLLMWLVGKPEARDAFKEASGHDLDRVLMGRGMGAMIDKATGYDRDVVAKFADWVTEFHWGDDADPAVHASIEDDDTAAGVVEVA